MAVNDIPEESFLEFWEVCQKLKCLWITEILSVDLPEERYRYRNEEKENTNHVWMTMSK